MGLPSSAMPPADNDDLGSIRSDLYSPQALLNNLSSSQRNNPSRRCPRVLSVLSSLLQRLVARNDRRAHSSSSSPPSSSSSSCPSSPLSFGSSSPYSSPSSSATAASASSLHGYNSSSKASRSLVLRSREGGDWSVFDGVRVPTIGIEEYLCRIFRYARCSPSCFVVAYAYLDRLIDHSSSTNHQQQQPFRVTSLNIHRLLITTVLVAAKFLDDMYYGNAYYAQIGGISTQEMNSLEKEFLFLIGFRLHVSVSVFESYCGHLEREVAIGGGYQIEKALRSICAMDGPDHSASNSNSINSILQRAQTSCLLPGVSVKLSSAA